MFLAVCGAHIDDEYSSDGRTKVLYASAFTFLGQDLVVRFTKALVELAFLHTALMCWLKSSLESMVTPKYLAEEEVASSWLCSLYGVIIGFLFFVILRISHLSGLKCIIQVCSHFSRAAKSSCSILVSSSEVIRLYTRLSSANSQGTNLSSPTSALSPRRSPVFASTTCVEPYQRLY